MELGISSRDERIVKLELDISLKDESLHLMERKIAGLEGEIARKARSREDFLKDNDDTILRSAAKNGNIKVVIDFIRKGAHI